MNKNKKILIISMISIIMSALVAIILVNRLSIKNPVFLMNYREIAVDEREEGYNITENLNLNYITNVQDTRKIASITFEEIPSTEFLILDDEPFLSPYKNKNENDISGRYKINTIQLECYDFKDINDSEEKIITKACVEFDDRSTLEVDLGKIVFYKRENEKVNVEGVNNQSSSDGESASIFNAKEDVRIEKIESPLYDKIEGVYTFDISSIIYDEEKQKFCKEGENIKKDSIITMSSKYINKDILKKYTIYDIRPKVYFINNENVSYSVRCNNMSHKSYYSDSDYEIYKYLKARGEL